MNSNFLIITLRKLTRHPGHTGINVFGLAVGMACCLLILTYARSEWSFDRFHEEADQIYRINIRATSPGNDVGLKAGQPIPLAPTLMESFNEIAAATAVVSGGGLLVTTGDTPATHDVQFVDQAFFDVFTFPLISGDATRALQDPGSAVVTRRTAVSLWGRDTVVGETLRIRTANTFQDFRVTAVAENPPGNSSIQFDIVLPIQVHSVWTRYADSWTSWVTNTFLRLSTGADVARVERRLPAFAAQHFAPMIQTWQILQWIGKDDGDFALELQPLTTIHFTPEIEQAATPATDPSYPGFLLGLAIAVLVIASINFTTLSMGRGFRYAREVGLRKTLGAGRWQIMWQFQGEALLMSLMAIAAALVLAELVLSPFSTLVDASLVIRYSADVVILIGGLTLLTALISGIGPAVFLSRFEPIVVMRGGSRTGRPNRWMQVLVVMQFTISVGFIMAVLVVQDQMDFMRQADLGFKKDNVLVVETMTSDEKESSRRVRRLKEAWGNVPEVESVAAASTGMNKSLSWSSFGRADGEAHTMYTSRIDRDWLNVMDVAVVAGRSYSADFPANDSTFVIVNEALVREFGWDHPIGQQVNNSGEVVGVVADYHFQSMHTAVEPMLLTLSARGDNPYRYIFVRLSGDGPLGSSADVIEILAAAWQEVVPDAPFTWSFLEDDLNVQYASERRAHRLMSAAALFAVLIACLGLFGLGAYAVERRTREIGIRKVVGASTFAIIRLVSFDFVVLTLISVVVAVPIAWIQMSNWLERFAFRVDIGWDTPVIAGLLAVIVALLAVSWHAFRAANADPVNSLRNE